MKKILIAFITLIAVGAAYAQDISSTCLQINELNNAVLNNTINRKKAAHRLDSLVRRLTYYESLKSTIDLPAKTWAFPLQGYGPRAIGGVKGNGYHDKGYNYLDGNKHTAHPAHDIFINDKNQDNLDDKTGKPVNVLAVDNGIVIACSNTWDPGSKLRGGKYIWLYHVYTVTFTYYAHNSAIFVSPGNVVKRGQAIAEVGRTGLNAYKKRSPTHLHFSVFKMRNGVPVPFNPYQQLISASLL